MKRKLAPVLYADVAGYRRLTGVDEEGTHRLLSESLDTVTDAIPAQNSEVLHIAGVNLAARLESLAEPGGIRVSGTMYDAAGTKLRLTYEFMGEQQEHRAPGARRPGVDTETYGGTFATCGARRRMGV